MDPHAPTGVLHERTDAEPRVVLRVLLWLLVGTALVAFGLVYLTRGLVAFERAGDPAGAPLSQPPGRQPPEPRLQTRPFVDLERQRDEERRLLTSYGWVDEKAGVVRIPIEAAKTLLLSRGLPVAAGAKAPQDPAPAGGRP